MKKHGSVCHMDRGGSGDGYGETHGCVCVRV